MADQDTSANENQRDYRGTLFLPNTEFPMRAGLPKAEPKWIEKWEEMKLYERLRKESVNRPKFVYHDGPPYANGDIHLGTAMNKILKDIVCRSHQMLGYDAGFIPGWDCHGLPIEWKVEEQFRAKGKTKDQVTGSEFRAACREYAAHWIDVQREQFRRLGVNAEWDETEGKPKSGPYLTMRFESEANIVSEFLRIAMSGLLYRGMKPIMWSPVEQTALAEAEVEYEDKKATTIWVKFPIASGGPEDASVVIWTTTPWTIPANQAVSFSNKISYGLYEATEVASEEELGFKPWVAPGDKIVVADALVESVFSAAKATAYKRVSDVDPTGWVLKHPFNGADWADGFWDQPIPLLDGDHVTDDAGTGFVHTAPAHGEDDYLVFLNNGNSAKDIRDIVDESGCYRDIVPERLRGLDIIRTSGKKRGQDGKAGPEVLKALMEQGALLARGLTTLRDAHSWRSKAPVIRRATPQWFIAMDKHFSVDVPDDSGKTLRERALAGIDQTHFVPDVGRNRLRSMVEGRPDWLISRQRNWGVPITLFVNSDGEPHTVLQMAAAINERILETIRKGGVDAWFTTPKEELLGDDANPDEWEKVTDVLDVWFDSGTTHAFTLRDRHVIDEETGQADVYLEGSDQHRGWFQSSLLECCATRGIAPYKNVVTHGFIMDGKGNKMSKSLGNTVNPLEVAEKNGIEILRIWTASSDFTEDLRISDEILKGNVESYRRLRNTFRYLLGALDGFDTREHVGYEDMPGLEKWVLHRVAELDELVKKSYKAFDYKRVMAQLINFCGVDLSAVYFDIRKDSLYCDPWSETRRRAARTVMDILLQRLCLWLAPVMPFTTEEAFQMSRHAEEADSVHLMTFPESPTEWKNDAISEQWAKIFKVRRVVTGALEIERRDRKIGSSLEGAPIVHIEDDALRAAFDGEDAADIFITSQALLTDADAPGSAFRMDEVPGVSVVVGRAEGQKCARSWKYFNPADADPEYPDITPRDADAVREWEATHHG